MVGVRPSTQSCYPVNTSGGPSRRASSSRARCRDTFANNSAMLSSGSGGATVPICSASETTKPGLVFGLGAWTAVTSAAEGWFFLCPLLLRSISGWAFAYSSRLSVRSAGESFSLNTKSNNSFRTCPGIHSALGSVVVSEAQLADTDAPGTCAQCYNSCQTCAA
jgi:hypothetical protein